MVRRVGCHPLLYAKATQKICGHRKVWKLANEMQDMIKLNYVKGTSGPYGEDTSGEWLDYDGVTELYNQVKGHIDTQSSLVPLWIDLHAKKV